MDIINLYKAMRDEFEEKGREPFVHSEERDTA